MVQSVFVWNARYETGLHVIDSQHHALVAFLNKFGDLYANEEKAAQVLRAFDEFAVYARFHFDTEEALMAVLAVSASHVATHKAAHSDFMAHILAERELVADDSREATGRLLAYLTRWLVIHILRTDRRLVSEVKALLADKSHEDARRIGENTLIDVQDVLLDSMVALYDELAVRTHQYQQANHELGEYARQLMVLTRMSSNMQTLASEEDMIYVVRDIAQEIFIGRGGLLAITKLDGGSIAVVAEWGERTALQRPDCSDCVARYPALARICPIAQATDHLQDKPKTGLCIPLVSQDEVMGMLVLAAMPDDDDRLTQRVRQLAELMAESLVLSVVNFRLRQSLRVQAIHDSLTGLHNRRYFDETAIRELVRAKRSQSSLCVVMFDIDHFKRFNDQFGHDAGDSVLRGVASQINREVREGDLICRYGGEEFIAIFTDTTMAVAMTRVAQILQNVRECNQSFRGVILPPVTLSAGVADVETCGYDADALVRAADEALYSAKHAGRNQAIVYTRAGPKSQHLMGTD